MKTTIELPDALAREAKALARADGVTLRELVVEGLRREVEDRSSRPRRADFCFPTATGSGLRPGIDPSQVIEVSYELPHLDR